MARKWEVEQARPGPGHFARDRRMELGHDSSAGAGRCSAVSCSCGNGRQKSRMECGRDAGSGLCWLVRAPSYLLIFIPVPVPVISISPQHQQAASASARPVLRFPGTFLVLGLAGAVTIFILFSRFFPHRRCFLNLRMSKPGPAGRQAGSGTWYVVRGRLRGICAMNMYRWH